MGKAQDVQLHIVVQEVKGANSLESTNFTHQSTISQPKVSKSWLRVAVYTLFVLSGQSAAILLGRLYYDEGGKSKWLATLVQLIGFPVLIPYYCISSSKKTAKNNVEKTRPSSLVLASIYVSLGLLLAADSVLYSTGLLYLPVSMFSLICVSQLAFNAFFSFLLNSQKFTPYIINSLFLLTVSSSLLMFNTNSEIPSGISRDKYTVGLVCTIGSSAGYGLMLSLTQLSFQKVLKTETFRAVLEMMIYQSLAASSATVLGLFISGEWKGLKREMEEFEPGMSSYFVILGSTAMAWQIFTVGTIGLIFEVSSLFSNVISVLGLPFVTVLAVIFFHDAMDGLKATAMLLALWGFASYIYQHYLDDSEGKVQNNGNADNNNVKEISLIPLLKEVSH
ncbi:Purine permease [Parasponia andersonii]|uniref:Probable purine permease n=1 Tax=Parasponia andersonii TaxID=3476 RepID=A0A2P5ATU8_PARAD|nr:Purine permease [Parasponia andersonii]